MHTVWRRGVQIELPDGPWDDRPGGRRKMLSRIGRAAMLFPSQYVVEDQGDTFVMLPSPTQSADGFLTLYVPREAVSDVDQADFPGKKCVTVERGRMYRATAVAGNTRMEPIFRKDPNRGGIPMPLVSELEVSAGQVIATYDQVAGDKDPGRTIGICDGMYGAFQEKMASRMAEFDRMLSREYKLDVPVGLATYDPPADTYHVVFPGGDGSVCRVLIPGDLNAVLFVDGVTAVGLTRDCGQVWFDELRSDGSSEHGRKPAVRAAAMMEAGVRMYAGMSDSDRHRFLERARYQRDSIRGMLRLLVSDDLIQPAGPYCRDDTRRIYFPDGESEDGIGWVEITPSDFSGVRIDPCAVDGKSMVDFGTDEDARVVYRKASGDASSETNLFDEGTWYDTIGERVAYGVMAYHLMEPEHADIFLSAIRCMCGFDPDATDRVAGRDSRVRIPTELVSRDRRAGTCRVDFPDMNSASGVGYVIVRDRRDVVWDVSGGVSVMDSLAGDGHALYGYDRRIFGMPPGYDMRGEQLEGRLSGILDKIEIGLDTYLAMGMDRQSNFQVAVREAIRRADEILYLAGSETPDDDIDEHVVLDGVPRDRMKRLPRMPGFVQLSVMDDRSRQGAGFLLIPESCIVEQSDEYGFLTGDSVLIDLGEPDASYVYKFVDKTGMMRDERYLANDVLSMFRESDRAFAELPVC